MASSSAGVATCLTGGGGVAGFAGGAGAGAGFGGSGFGGSDLGGSGFGGAAGLGGSGLGGSTLATSVDAGSPPGRVRWASNSPKDRLDRIAATLSSAASIS